MAKGEKSQNADGGAETLMAKAKKKSSGGIVSLRVYEYQDADGNVFWSFTKLPQLISPPLRLALQSRIGTHVINFLVKMRRRAEDLGRGSGRVQDKGDPNA